MYLYIKTPLASQSKYIPHLVEHCAVLPKNGNIQDFFAFAYRYEADCYSTYTVMEFPENQTDTLLRALQIPLEPWQVMQEKKILREELQDINFAQELLENLFCTIYQTRFNLNHTARASFQEIFQYHRQYYTPKNWILCDEKYRICSDSYHFQSSSFPSPQIGTEKFCLKVRGYKNFIRTTPKSPKSHIWNAFLQELIDTWGMFAYRFGPHPTYHIPVDTYFFRSENVDILAMSEVFPEIREEFFLVFQKEFCEKSLENHFINKTIVLIFLHLGVLLTYEDVLQYMRNFSYQEYREYIGNPEEYHSIASW